MKNNFYTILVIFAMFLIVSCGNDTEKTSAVNDTDLKAGNETAGTEDDFMYQEYFIVHDEETDLYSVAEIELSEIVIVDDWIEE
ncbi:MAG: hypothetical protein KAG96_01690 [Ichthyobacteriaceae bacterium]|nr:hypothetical protein [Ichthyobacteriaceae bacterium]